MLISRIVALSWGSLTSWLVVFMISVDFWKAPVTLTMARVVSGNSEDDRAQRGFVQNHGRDAERSLEEGVADQRLRI
jgi:hypothetical protein